MAGHRSLDTLSDERSRGQVAIGTLVVFIAVVLIAAVTVGVFFDVTSGLQYQSSSTGSESFAQLTDRLDVVVVTGSEISETEPHTMGRVTVIVTHAGGGDVDLTNVTTQWHGPDGGFNLLSDRASDGGGPTFETEALNDDAGTFPVLTSTEQRFALRFEPGDDFGSSELAPGESVSIQLTTESRASTTVRFTVPQSLTGESAVTL